MKLLLAMIALVTAMTLTAQSVPPSEMFDAAAIRSAGDALLQQAKASPQGLASKLLLTRPDGSEQLAVRVKSGQGEWHHDFADVLIVLEGEGQIVTGGEIVHGKETAAGEIRGDGVQGGKVQPFRAGDVIRIEPQVAHQVLLAPGGSIRYFAVKVRTSK